MSFPKLLSRVKGVCSESRGNVQRGPSFIPPWSSAHLIHCWRHSGQGVSCGPCSHRVPGQLGGWIHSQTVTVQSSQGCSEENSTHGSSDAVWGYMRQGGLHREGHMEGGCAGGWRGSSKLKLRRRLGLQTNVLGDERVGISAEVGN